MSVGILTQLKTAVSVVWKNTQGVKFLDTTGVDWYSSDVVRISTEAYAGDNYWDDYIISFTPPHYSLANTWGGYCSMNFGDIELSLDLFSALSVSGNSVWEDSDVVWADADVSWFSDPVYGNESNLWPIPAEMAITQEFTLTNESSASILFDGTMYLQSYNRESANYDLYGTSFEQNLLNERVDYTEETVPVYRAFGKVQHRKPLRLADVGGYPVYHNGHMGGNLAISISGTSDNGSGKVRFTTATNHGFSNGDTVTVEVTDFDSTYNTSAVIAVIDATTFDFDSIAYVDDLTGHAFKEGDWAVYDDGVPISGNVTDNGDYTFTLSSALVNEITISGTGEYSTLSEIFAWACSAALLDKTYAYSSAIEENPSPTVKYWANSQRKLIDFLSDLSAFFNHLFYFTTNNGYLVDMTKDNGSRTLTEYDYFASPSYQYDPPVALLKSEWKMWEAVEETIGKYVKEEDYDAEVTSGYPYGTEETTIPFHTDRSEVQSRLRAILTSRLKQRVSLKIPVSDDLPVPGELITFTDNSFKTQLTGAIRARRIVYDFEDDSVQIEGEGVVS